MYEQMKKYNFIKDIVFYISLIKLFIFSHFMDI